MKIYDKPSLLGKGDRFAVDEVELESDRAAVRNYAFGLQANDPASNLWVSKWVMTYRLEN